MRVKNLSLRIPWCEPENYLGIDWEPQEEKHHPHNLMPTPHKEITQSEFDAILHCNPECLLGINYRQVFISGERTIGPAHFYFFRHVAIVVVSYSVGMKSEKAKDKPGTLVCRGKWYHRLRYFQVGCNHPNLKTYWKWMHDKVDECPDCGFKATYDTSG